MRNHLETHENAETVVSGAPAPGRLLAFRVGGRRYALPIAAVLGVAEEGQGGTVRHRDREVPVEGARDLGFGEARPGERGAAVLVLAAGGGPRALRVDAVEGFVAAAGVRPWPPSLAALVGPGFPGVADGPEGPMLLVDAEALFVNGGPRPPREAGETS